jgi:amidase
METLYGPNAGLTEVLIPAGYVGEAWDPVFKLSEDRRRYVSAPAEAPTPLAAPGLGAGSLRQ